MRYIVIILCLSAATAAGAPRPSAPESESTFDVEKIIAGRNALASARGDLEMEWNVAKRLRTETFGKQSPHVDSKNTPIIRFRLQNQRLLLTGDELCPDWLRQLTIGLDRKAEDAQFMSSAFKSHLNSKFQLQQSPPRRQPYQLIVEPTAEWHLWNAAKELRAAAVKCPTGMSSLFFATPISMRLADAVQCAIGSAPVLPSNHPSASETSSVLSDIQYLDGQGCRVIEIKSLRTTAPWTRQYWFSNDQRRQLLRCVFKEDREIFVDFEYRPNEPPVLNEQFKDLPQRISILQSSSEGNIEDELIVVLKGVRRAVPSPKSIGRPPVTEGTLVTDFIAGKRFLVRADGKLREVSLDDMVNAGQTRSDFVTHWFHLSQQRREIGEQLLIWMTWPYILVPLLLFIATCAGANRIILRIPKKRAPAERPK